LTTPEIAAENGLLENLQVVLLLMSTLLFLVRTYALSKANNLALLSYGLFVSTFPFIGVGREVSFGSAVGASAQGVLAVQVVMGAVVGVVLVAALVVFVRFVDSKLATIRRLLVHPTSLSIYLAILVFGVSSVFEQGAFGLSKSALLEELVDLLAFALLVRAAWVLR